MSRNMSMSIRFIIVDRLVSKELYNISLCSIYEKPASQSYCQKLLQTTNLNWNKIYILLRKVSIKYFSGLKRFHHYCVLFATLRMKRRRISSILVILASEYGTNFTILILRFSLFLYF